jgi:quinohemoprotein ethanol dehydrogenase
MHPCNSSVTDLASHDSKLTMAGLRRGTLVKRCFGICALCILSAMGIYDIAPAGRAAESSYVNWVGHGGNSDEADYSALEQINKANVDRLGLAWYLDLPGEQMLEATPLEVNGVLYFTGTQAKVYAVDTATGKLLWTYDPEIWKHGPQKMHYALPCNRGVAYEDGRVFVGTVDGRLIALDAKTGASLWSAETTPPGSFQTITGAPRAFNRKVVIGNGGGDFGARGYVTAYDAATGRQAWRFYTVPGSPEENRGDAAMEKAAATWSGSYWKTGTGGGPWDSITFDKDLNRIYIGTGNAAPYDPEQRSPGDGDNLYTASIVALDADTGKYVWHYQLNPRDSWDFDSTAQMSLAQLVIDGRRRKVLIQAPKNGFLYVIDRVTGKLISAGKIGKTTWADHIDIASGRPVEAADIRYQHGPATIWPSPLGAHNWQSMSFRPKTGLVYIPYLQLGMRYAKGQGKGKDVSMVGISMSIVEKDSQDGKGALLAYDPVRQQVRWKVQHPYFWNGGTLATGGNLVFQGAADGYLTAYEAGAGKVLWRFNAGLGIISAPISYAVGGTQYLTVLVGYGGSNSAGDLMNAGWKYGAQPRRLLTFRLNGNATLPPAAPPDFTLHPAKDSSATIDPADAGPGQLLFAVNCGGCHGLNVVSGGAPAPDLRESPVAMDPTSFWSVVHDGALLQKGMPRFDQLDAAQLRQIQAYIRLKTREAVDAHAGSTPGGTQPGT